MEMIQNYHQKLLVWIEQAYHTLLQSLTVILRWSRAQARRRFFIAAVSLGFLEGRWPVKPSSANLLWTVRFETAIPDSWIICVKWAALFFLFAIQMSRILRSERGVVNLFLPEHPFLFGESGKFLSKATWILPTIDFETPVSLAIFICELLVYSKRVFTSDNFRGEISAPRPILKTKTG